MSPGEDADAVLILGEDGKPTKEFLAWGDRMLRGPAAVSRALPEDEVVGYAIDPRDGVRREVIVCPGCKAPVVSEIDRYCMDCGGDGEYALDIEKIPEGKPP